MRVSASGAGMSCLSCVRARAAAAARVRVQLRWLGREASATGVALAPVAGAHNSRPTSRNACSTAQNSYDKSQAASGRDTLGLYRQLRAVHCFQEDTSIVRLSLGPSRRRLGYTLASTPYPGVGAGGDASRARAREDPIRQPSTRRGKRGHLGGTTPRARAAARSPPRPTPNLREATRRPRAGRARAAPTTAFSAGPSP
jgi:hypothetical protein